MEAELTAYNAWDKAMKGVDFVQHIASPVPATLPKHEDEIIVPAREGTLNVLKAAEKHGVKRVVHTSSVAAIGYGHSNNNQVFTEASWTNINDSKDTTPYIRSKTIAEKAAWKFMEATKTNLELTVINPVLVLGPVLEKDYGTSALLVKKFLEGELPGVPNIGFGLVDVRDLAELNRLAMTSPHAAGQRFIAFSNFIWMKEIVAILKEAYPNYKKKLPKFGLPNFLMRLFSLFDPEIRSVIHELGIERSYTSDFAQKTLGWQPRSGKEALKATADSLIALKLV